MHCAPLRNQYGEIVNFVGVQCIVDDKVASSASKHQQPTGVLTVPGFGGGGGSDDDEGDGGFGDD